MKYALKNTLSIFLTIALFASVNAQGIEFHKGDWESTLKKAKKENKIIFVDAYTTWCGPCKWMSANVFPDQAVGDYYNENFINAKIDMEKGEGILFEKAYGVMAYPTLLYINSKGEMVHKGLGGREASDFIALGQAANDPKKQIGSLERKYRAGKRDATLLKSYTSALIDAGMPGASTIALEYLNSQDDWTTEENMDFIYNSADFRNMDDKLFQEIATNKEAYRTMFGKDNVDYVLKQAPSIKAGSMPGIPRKEIEAIFHQVFPDNYKQYADEFEMNTKYGTNEYVEAAVNYLNKYDIQDSNQLNEIAWAVYELSDDKKILKLAKEWTERSIKLNGNYMNYDTLAAICFKLKDKKEAMKHAKTAINMAKAEGQDASLTEELLEKIQGL